MGSRANFVVVDEGGWRLYYSHWGAQSVDVHLAGGPAHAVAFIEAQEVCDRTTGWLDERWGEGGALVDLTSRELLFFGGFEVMHELEYRRAFFALLAQTWPGWTVRWAYDELAEFVGYVGGDPAVVRVLKRPPPAPADRRWVHPAPADSVADGSWVLLTVRGGDGRVLSWAMLPPLAHPAWAGPGLLDLLDQLPDPGARLATSAARPPRYGLHMDVAARRLGWWTAETAPGLAEELPARWPGWTAECWQDRYEEHVRVCGGAVAAPPIDIGVGFDRVTAWLAAEWRDPVAGALDVADTLRAEGAAVEVTAPITAHREVAYDDRDRQRITAALAAARAAIPPSQ